MPAALQPSSGDHDRISAFFDRQLLEASDLNDLLRATAEMCGGAVGLVRPDGTLLTSSALGRMPESEETRVVRALPGGGEIWADATRVDAHLVLERLAVVVGVLDRIASARVVPGMTSFELLSSDNAPVSHRSAALRRLGLTSTDQVRVAVFSGPTAGVREFGADLRKRFRVDGQIEDRECTFFLIPSDHTTLAIDGVPTGVRAGYSRPFPAALTNHALTNALGVYKYTRPSPGPDPRNVGSIGVWVDGARVRGFEVLLRLRPEDYADVSDLHGLEALVEEHGPIILQILQAYSTTESMRAAAALVHMHHNTMAHWVQRAKVALGYSEDESLQRAKIFIALCLYIVSKEAP